MNESPDPIFFNFLLLLVTFRVMARGQKAVPATQDTEMGSGGAGAKPKIWHLPSPSFVCV